jgi:hypothetical protein
MSRSADVAAAGQIVFERGAWSGDAELVEIEGKQFHGVVATGERRAQLARQQMRVGSRHDEPPALRPVKLSPQPPLPSGHPLDLVEQVGAATPAVRLERVDHQLQRGVIQRRGEPRILEVHEQAPGTVETVAVDQLPKERRFSGSPHALHDHGDVGAQLHRQGDRPGNRRRRGRISVAPVGGNPQKTGSIHRCRV